MDVATTLQILLPSSGRLWQRRLQGEARESSRPQVHELWFEQDQEVRGRNKPPQNGEVLQISTTESWPEYVGPEGENGIMDSI